jgi:hypothetical protein
MAEAPPAKPLAELSPAPAKPAAQVVISKSMLAPPDPAAGKLLEPLAAPAPAPEAPAASTPASPPASPAQIPVVASTAEPDPASPAPLPVQRTEFGIDLGGANSLDGLRTMWQRLIRSNKTLGALHPIVTVKERGAGMQLRLVAGPISDAATAAKLCAGMAAADYFCETTLFDGQRLSMPAAKPSNRKRTSAVAIPPEPEPPAPPAPASVPPPQQPHSGLMTLLGVH